MQEVTINGRWKLKVPEHRVDQWSRPWEEQRIESMSINIKPGDVVYDVGAEQFDMSGLFASWGAQMVLIEPSKWGWPTGKAIFEANDLVALHSVHGFACSNTEKSNARVLKFPDWPESADDEINVSEGFAVLNQRPDIPRISLDDLWADYGVPAPDVISMDVEGAEFEVLKGAERIIEEIKPLIYVSEHPEFAFTEFGYYMADMHSWMHAHGYQFRFLGWDHEIHVLWWHPKGKQPAWT